MDMASLPTLQEIVLFYDHLTLHIVPGPRSLSYFIPFLLTVIALLLPPRILSRRQIHWGVLPSIYTSQLYVWLHHKSYDVISMNMALTAFMLLGWYDVRNDFYYVRRQTPDAVIPAGGHEDVRVSTSHSRKQPSEIFGLASRKLFLPEPYPKSFPARLKWTILLLSSMRLTDWHIGIPSHDSRQPGQIKLFRDFVADIIPHSIFAYVLLDFTSPYMMSMTYEQDLIRLNWQHLSTRIVRSLILLAHFYAALSLLLALLPHLLSIFAMFWIPSLRSNSLASPLTWPSLFGPVSSIYTVSSASRSRKLGLRAFWGVFWHQNMRYITSTPGVALVSVLNLPRESKLRYMIIVASGFFWSGMVHMGVVPPEPLDTRMGLWELRLRIASFFWLQVLGIWIEETAQSAAYMIRARLTDQVKECSKRTLPTQPIEHRNGRNGIGGVLLKAFLCMWTIGFLAFTAWWTVLPVGCELGWWNIRLIPISILGTTTYV